MKQSMTKVLSDAVGMKDVPQHSVLRQNNVSYPLQLPLNNEEYNPNYCHKRFLVFFKCSLRPFFNRLSIISVIL